MPKSANAAIAAILLCLLGACASTEPPTATNPYGSPDGQRERAGKATQELDRSAAKY